ncbi:TPR repeat precursor [Bradyrhizobium sp. STM 3843]|nr:TPR repeat precursor [Bradyrhizobium sp. STM 3843]
MSTHSTRTLFAAGLITAAVASGSFGQQDQQLGKVSFPTSCAPDVQAEFDRGVAMLHSYWFLIARRKFEAILQQDPDCAMAYWGVAMDLLGNTLATTPTRAEAQAAWEALEKARTAGPKTQRERDWIEALSAYFRDYDNRPVDARLAAYNAAMERMAQTYPDDYEVQAYYALTLQASAPKSDLTYAQQLKSAALLEKLFEQNPQHPGVTHYLIHAYDFAPLAEKGVASARRYAGIAPAVPHARHMPSHIYSMVGLWEESIASNASALEIQPDYYHASDFTVYAYLQLAQDAKADAMIRKSLATADRGDRPINFVNFTAKAAMPARYVLERADWAGAAALPMIPTKYPMADSLIRFTRGLGMARTGDLAGAREEIDAMKVLRTTLQGADQSYWADRTEEQMLAVSAWVALKEGDRDRALRYMRAAADSEDGSLKHVAMENRLFPFRELLGEMLLEIGQPAAALSEFETALKQTPNRFRGFWGAARAADGLGNHQKAVEYFGKLVELAKNADAERPEIREAKAYLQRDVTVGTNR